MDAASQIQTFVMDATRIADGLRVMIKAIDTTESIEKHEWRIARIFNHPDLIGDPRNHCIPTIDYVRYPGRTWELLVTPQLYPFHVTPFETFREVADFVHQLLEGVAFMHEVNVPHRDIGPLNLMMFSPDLFPKGTSALWPGHETDIESPLSKYRARRDVYVRYYLIDFGLSWSFSSEATRRPLQVAPGQYKDAPEYAHSTYCDGFALDVWCIGKLIQEEFARTYRLPPFMLDFAALLMRPIPTERPTAAAALSTFEAGVAQLGPGALDLPLWPDQPKPSLVKSLRRVLSAEPVYPLSIPRDAPPPRFEFSPRLARYNQ